MERSHSLNIDRSFAMRAVDILSTLNCLNYLTSEEAEDSAKVRQYTAVTQERLKEFAELFGPLLWLPNQPRYDLFRAPPTESPTSVDAASFVSQKSCLRD